MMAGDWIKMRHDLPDDPAVIALCDRLGLDADTVVGKLHRLWTWSDKHTTDGFAKGITAGWVDRHVRSKGFADSLVFVGWVNFSDDGIEFVNFTRHNGESAKKRATNTARQKVSRNSRDESATEARQTRDRSATRGEESRAEDTKGIPPVAARRAPKGADDAPLLIPKPPKVLWTQAGGWENIDEDRLGIWRKAYPACNIDQQLLRMHAWLRENPERAPKSNYGTFITTWLRKEQNHGGDMRNSNANGNRNRNRPDSHSEAADRRAAKAAREFPEPDLELPVFVFGGDKRADDSQRPSASAPRSQAGGA
jgi:hypothetical protein